MSYGFQWRGQILWLPLLLTVVIGWLSFASDEPQILVAAAPTPPPISTPSSTPLPTYTLTITAAPTTVPTATPTDFPTPTAVPPIEGMVVTRLFTTPIPTHTPLPTAAPTATPVPLPVNGLMVDDFLIMPPEVRANVQAIFAYGQTLGRNPRHFSKLGDSLVDTEHFLARFDTGPSNLGDYAYLQAAVAHYTGSFARVGPTIRNGLNTWAVFDPFWADKELCQPGEHMLACEFRLYNPSILLILLGTNDPGHLVFEQNLAEIVVYTVDNGVIPVLVTKANRIEGDDSYNSSLRRVAAAYQVPLWDFDRVAETVAERGLDQDRIHLTVFPENDYTLRRALYSGYGVLNLTGLMVLYTLWQQLLQ
ncbi:MAG: hypothetical protein KJ063_12335 [Anaerolineae bacterium]|nr:hypothetical protein [Anaerolineae bacterium]